MLLFSTQKQGARTTYILDVEIYSSQGVKVWQQYANCNLSLSAGTTCILPWTWAPTATGTFTVQIGVFSTDWTKNYAWNANAGTITVGTAREWECQTSL